MAHVLGIDFGTTKSAAARWDKTSGQPRLIRLGRSRDAIPSIIHADKAGLLSFGEDAADYLQRDPSGCVEQIKRQLGHTRTFPLHGRDFTTATLIGAFLHRLREDAEELSLRGRAERVALAVPALFGQAQREEFREAAAQAGFSDFELIDEPVAAGFAYFAVVADDPAARVLVFDWGGGTLDLALIEKVNDAWEVHGELVTGDEYLGGEDFDLLLLEEVNRRLRTAGLRPYAARLPAEQALLRQRVRELKHEHARKHGAVEWRFHLAEREEPLVWEWNLEEFQTLFQETLERAAQCLRELLAKCAATNKSPHFILLVGGTTLFPGLADLLEIQTSVPVRRWEHSADAVALGATVYAARGLHAVALLAEEPETTRPVAPPPISALPPPLRNPEAEQHLRAAEKLAEKGELAEAMIKADLAATMSPHSAAPFLLKARLYQTAQNHEATIANATRALELESGCAEAQMLRGTSRFQSGDAVGAIPDLTTALQAEPDSTARMLLASALYRTGSHERCIEELETLRQKPAALKTLNLPREAFEAAIALLLLQRGAADDKAAQALSAILQGFPHRAGDIAAMAGMCRDFGETTLAPDPAATFQEKLWEACKTASADTRQSAAHFVKLNPLELRGTWWQAKAHFLHAVAVAAAESNKPDLAVECLTARFLLPSPLLLTDLLSEPGLVSAARKSPKVRKLLTPDLACEHWKNLLANSLSVTNRSGFPVSEVKVTLLYQHEGSKNWQSSEFSAPVLEPGKSQTWPGVFKDPGWLGGKIGEIEISASCAEEHVIKEAFTAS